MSTVTLGGNPVKVAGNFPKAGDAAPDFTLTGKDLKDVRLKDFAGKRKVLAEHRRAGDFSRPAVRDEALLRS